MKKRTALKISIFVLAALIVISSAVVIYAYFLTRPVVFNSDGTEQYATLGMEISLLFDKLDSSLDGTELPITGTDGEAFSFDPDATWGTAENPYIISDVRHLYNLSALQPIGYFKSVFGSPLDSSNPAQTTLTADDLDDGTKIPYFLVCNTDGTPVTIDGSDMTIAPIGTYDNPFIGYIGGAFVEGTTTVNGKASSVSAIDGVTVSSTEDVVDIGLFGHIGYIGSESDSFYAITTTIRDLLISDVKIEIRNPTPWEAVSSAVHRFTYSLLSGDEQAQAAHENHHVGIFAGHAEYATLEYISIYYSSDDITAIDISHTSASSDSETANYSSVSGILGFIYNINPEINDNGTVAGGSGTSNADLISAGISSGGGLLSGVGRGYLDAATIYGKYAVASGGDGTQTRDRGQIIWEYYKTADSVNKTYG
ncbi:MAG: hypothetical protein HUJ65_01050, partial [Oscillospiraceae bacterium]|nr:hypothetical protein [Oscillospiraceae bacterium]